MNRFAKNILCCSNPSKYSVLFFLLCSFTLCWFLSSLHSSGQLHHPILKNVYYYSDADESGRYIISDTSACTTTTTTTAAANDRRDPMLKQSGHRPVDDSWDMTNSAEESTDTPSSKKHRDVMISGVTSADSRDRHNSVWNMPDHQSGRTSPAAAKFCAKSRDVHRHQSCDLTKGRWVQHQSPPPYTTHTCSYIHNSNQNCMKNGRQDTGFLQWRWKPRDCELPPFDPTLFLELMRNRKILFVGDSMARNHMESLLCTLVQVEEPAKQDKYWMFRGIVNFTFTSYNFTLGGVWAPYLVMTVGGDPSGRTQIPTDLHLDKPNELWSSILPLYDVAVFSGAYWLMRDNNYFMNDLPVPQHYLVPPESPSPSQLDPQLVSKLHAMEIIWRTVYRHLLQHFNGVAVIRTLSISHFENATWHDRGYCNRTLPYSDEELQGVGLDWQQSVLYGLQMRTYREAEAGVKGKNGASRLKLRLMDVTYGSLLRPDGHPALNRMQNSPDAGIFDCLHWCQPGPVDTWNQLLLADPEIMCPSTS